MCEPNEISSFAPQASKQAIRWKQPEADHVVHLRKDEGQRNANDSLSYSRSCNRNIAHARIQDERFTPSKACGRNVKKKAALSHRHTPTLQSSNWDHSYWVKRRFDNLRLNVYISADGIYPRRACWEDYANRSVDDDHAVSVQILDRIQADTVSGMWSCCKKKKQDAAGCCAEETHVFDPGLERCAVCSKIYPKNPPRGIYERSLRATACASHSGPFKFLALGVGHWACCGGDISAAGCCKAAHVPLRSDAAAGAAEEEWRFCRSAGGDQARGPHHVCLRCQQPLETREQDGKGQAEGGCRWHAGCYVAAAVRTRSLPPSAPDAVLVTVDMQEVRVQFWISETVGTDGCTNRFAASASS